MSSTSLQRWQTDRMPRLELIDAQCASSLAAALPNPQLIEENLRGYVVLLSAHFQGFCRELYIEASQIIVSKVRATLQVLIQSQFDAQCALDHGNPNLPNLKRDFERLGFRLSPILNAETANALRLQHLAELNEWRNIAAHHGAIPASGPLNLPFLRNWRNSCDGLAISLDGIIYNQLRRLLRRAPWIP